MGFACLQMLLHRFSAALHPCRRPLTSDLPPPAPSRPLTQAPADYDGKVPYISAVLTPSHLHPHLLVVGWVTAVEQNGLWLTLAPGIQGRVHVFETSQNPEQLAVPLEERFSVGQALQVNLSSKVYVQALGCGCWAGNAACLCFKEWFSVGQALQVLTLTRPGFGLGLAGPGYSGQCMCL